MFGLFFDGGTSGPLGGNAGFRDSGFTDLGIRVNGYALYGLGARGV